VELKAVLLTLAGTAGGAQNLLSKGTVFQNFQKKGWRNAAEKI